MQGKSRHFARIFYTDSLAVHKRHFLLTSFKSCLAYERVNKIQIKNEPNEQTIKWQALFEQKPEEESNNGITHI